MSERKTLQFKADSFDDEQGIFSGVAAVYGNIDSGGDIIEPGAFQKALEDGIDRIKILALHNDCWLPVGKPLELRDEKEGLFIKGKISDTSMGKDVKILLRDGVLGELSIGYDPVVFDYDENGIRHLREVRLWEVSIVTWAMNPEAVITGYKSLVDSVATDIKAGRKISASRLASLKEASRSMKAAVDALDAIISEAGGESDTGKKADNNKTQTKSAVKLYEIMI